MTSAARPGSWPARSHQHFADHLLFHGRIGTVRKPLRQAVVPEVLAEHAAWLRMGLRDLRPASGKLDLPLAAGTEHLEPRLALRSVLVGTRPGRRHIAALVLVSADGSESFFLTDGTHRGACLAAGLALEHKPLAIGRPGRTDM